MTHNHTSIWSKPTILENTSLKITSVLKMPDVDLECIFKQRYRPGAFI
jgi:hypothetical protein